jgi:hypothetical protein
MAGDEIWYHGVGPERGGRAILIEDAAGHELGVLRHVVHHSPTGMTWGYAGSGGADCARSLLVAALGDRARCPECAGTQKIGYDRNARKDVPYDPSRPDDFEPETVGQCWCDDGYRRLPYQDFKFELVAKWGAEFRISRSDILTWLSMHADWEG